MKASAQRAQAATTAGQCGDFAEIVVRCECGAQRRLAEAMAPGAEPDCQGERPWLGPEAREPDCYIGRRTADIFVEITAFIKRHIHIGRVKINRYPANGDNIKRLAFIKFN